MNNSAKAIEIRLERLIPAPPHEVFAAWLDAKTPGTVWNAAEKFSLDPRIDGLFYWTLKGTAHYGRFTALQSPALLQHTWVSPATLGLESIVTVTFQERSGGTLLTLVHSALPDTPEARGHERGWTYFLGVLREQFGDGSRKKFVWDEAHPSAE